MKILKRLLSVLLLITALCLITTPAVLAENFTYKVYNPKTNKAYNAVLGTVTITDTQYIWGFYTQNGEPLCVASLITNKNSQGLVGSQCTDANAFVRFMNGDRNIDLSKYELGWRELSTDTFYREMDAIRRERATQGKYEYRVSN